MRLLRGRNDWLRYESTTPPNDWMLQPVGAQCVCPLDVEPTNQPSPPKKKPSKYTVAKQPKSTFEDRILLADLVGASNN